MQGLDHPIRRGALVLAALSCAAAACGGTEPDVPDARFEAYVSGPANNSYEADVTVCGQDGVEPVRTTVHLTGTTNGTLTQLLADDVLRADFAENHSGINGMAVVLTKLEGNGVLETAIWRDGVPVATNQVGSASGRAAFKVGCPGVVFVTNPN